MYWNLIRSKSPCALSFLNWYMRCIEIIFTTDATLSSKLELIHEMYWNLKPSSTSPSSVDLNWYMRCIEIHYQTIFLNPYFILNWYMRCIEIIVFIILICYVNLELIHEMYWNPIHVSQIEEEMDLNWYMRCIEINSQQLKTY